MSREHPRRIGIVGGCPPPGHALQAGYNNRHTYATITLMAGVTPAFCAMQLGHSVELFLRTNARWTDGGENALESSRLEVALTADLSPIYPKKGT